MRRDLRKYLWDAARAVEQARSSTEGYSFDGYFANAMLLLLLLHLVLSQAILVEVFGWVPTTRPPFHTWGGG
jgi:hypothetical protein